MDIKSASFVKSSPTVALCPDSRLPEYAFIGRSNVGKSSLINMLVAQKNLAMTSSKPGKTLLINHFIVNEQWHLVDLPGYGFANVPKDVRAKLEPMIKGYILKREQLTNLFLLIDVRHEPQKVDLEFMEFLGENGVPFSIVFTKADKLGPMRVKENVEAYQNALLEQWEELPPIFITSSEKKQGRTELLDYIEEINASLNN
ncbi:MAG: ribosome biogenesis GTP-binding protein YihA/YsxC [Paludibacteraceae bacterium]|nr:YihA family ribosome biogenesis GTP-binding protein [Candidatus Physcocola equi]MCQ2235185.1 ribosome biogenesis GTP-binding protein YihA/YsxC [Paludibacteraceae bacterium]